MEKRSLMEDLVKNFKIIEANRNFTIKKFFNCTFTLLVAYFFLSVIFILILLQWLFFSMFEYISFLRVFKKNKVSWIYGPFIQWFYYATIHSFFSIISASPFKSVTTFSVLGFHPVIQNFSCVEQLLSSTFNWSYSNQLSRNSFL